MSISTRIERLTSVWQLLNNCQSARGEISVHNGLIYEIVCRLADEVHVHYAAIGVLEQQIDDADATARAMFAEADQPVRLMETLQDRVFQSLAHLSEQCANERALLAVIDGLLNPALEATRPTAAEAVYEVLLNSPSPLPVAPNNVLAPLAVEDMAAAMGCLVRGESVEFLKPVTAAEMPDMVPSEPEPAIEAPAGEAEAADVAAKATDVVEAGAETVNAAPPQDAVVLPFAPHQPPASEPVDDEDMGIVGHLALLDQPMPHYAAQATA